MDNIIASQYQELDEDIIPVEVVTGKREIVSVPDKEVVEEAVERERLKRKLEITAWAEKKRLIVDAPPTEAQLNKVMKRLKKGFPILKALKRICSYTTWCRWREEYPVLMKMEEEAREYRIENLMDKQQMIADQVDRDKMGQIARDKLRIDALQSQIDRMDRLTAARNAKQSTNPALIPIQINVGYGKRK